MGIKKKTINITIVGANKSPIIKLVRKEVLAILVVLLYNHNIFCITKAASLSSFYEMSLRFLRSHNQIVLSNRNVIFRNRTKKSDKLDDTSKSGDINANGRILCQLDGLWTH